MLRTLRLPAAATGAIAIGLLTAIPASAHVSINASETAADSYTVLEFGVPHGCDGSPTTSVHITIPDELNSVTATRHPFYDLKYVMGPIEGSTNGSERVESVVYTATTPLPDGVRDSLELSVHLPADGAGSTLYFPTVQTCAKGETAWTQIPEEGSDAELDSPAPSVTITEAVSEGHGGHDHGGHKHQNDDAAKDGDSGHSAMESNATDQPTGAPALTIVALIVGIAGLAVGAVALLRGRKTSTAAR